MIWILLPSYDKTLWYCYSVSAEVTQHNYLQLDCLQPKKGCTVNVCDDNGSTFDNNWNLSLVLDEKWLKTVDKRVHWRQLFRLFLLFTFLINASNAFSFFFLIRIYFIFLKFCFIFIIAPVDEEIVVPTQINRTVQLNRTDDTTNNSNNIHKQIEKDSNLSNIYPDGK